MIIKACCDFRPIRVRYVQWNIVAPSENINNFAQARSDVCRIPNSASVYKSRLGNGQLVRRRRTIEE